MCLRHLAALCLALLFVGTGCQKSSSSQADASSGLPPLAPDTVLRVHWVGKRQLILDGSAFYFNRLWDLQETRAVESRAFDNLTLFPWRLLHKEAVASNA